MKLQNKYKQAAHIAHKMYGRKMIDDNTEEKLANIPPNSFTHFPPNCSMSGFAVAGFYQESKNAFCSSSH